MLGKTADALREILAGKEPDEIGAPVCDDMSLRFCWYYTIDNSD